MKSQTQPKQETTSFDRAASNYHEHAHVQAALADWLAEWLPVKRSGLALEIGAGPGVFTRRILPWAGAFVATDISPAMCAVGWAALPQVEWRVMAAERPEPGPWDWIFSSSMLQWAEHPESLFAAWREQLAPSGRLLAGLFIAESLPEWREMRAGNPPLVWRTAEEWRESLVRGGLHLERDETQRRTFEYPTARAFLRSLHGVGAAPHRRLPPAQLRRLLGEYEARFGTSAGVRATWVFYRLEARQAR